MLFTGRRALSDDDGVRRDVFATKERTRARARTVSADFAAEPCVVGAESATKILTSVNY